MSTLTYLKSFLKDKDVASVTPTSRFCLRRVCKPVDFTEDITIVEYGAGAGGFAKYLLPKMTPGSRLFLFETNERMVEKLRVIYDARVSLFNKCVEIVTDMIEDELIGMTVYNNSDIPFSLLHSIFRTI